MSVKVRVCANGTSKPFRLDNSVSIESLTADIRERFSLSINGPLSLSYLDPDDKSKQTISSTGDLKHFVQEAAILGASQIIDLTVENSSNSNSSPSSSQPPLPTPPAPVITASTSTNIAPVPQSSPVSSFRPPISGPTSVNNPPSRVAPSVSTVNRVSMASSAPSITSPTNNSYINNSGSPASSFKRVSSIMPSPAPSSFQSNNNNGNNVSGTYTSNPQGPRVITSSSVVFPTSPTAPAAQKLMGDFNNAVSAGDIDRVISISSSILSVDPDNFTVLYNRGAAYASRDQHQNAIPDFSFVIQLCPNHLQALTGRGNSYIALGVIDKGIADLTSALRLEPKLAAAHHGLSVAYARTARYAEASASETAAIDIVEKEGGTAAVHVGVGLEEMYYNRGWSLSRSGLYPAAVSDFSRALALNPRLLKALTSRSKVYANTGDWRAALSDYARMAQIEPNNHNHTHMQAVAFHTLGDFTSAVEADTASINIAPSFPGYYNRALSHARLDHIKEAIADNTAAINLALKPNSGVEKHELAHAYCNRGCLYSSEGNWEAAIADWTASINLYPTTNALNLRALAHYQNGDIQAALNDWDASIALEPNYQALLQRGNHRVAEGKPEQALQDYNKAIDLVGGDKVEGSDAYANRAAALLMLGDYDGALKDAKKALETKPDSAALHHVKALAERGLGLYDDAVIDHNHALRLDPTNEIYQKAAEEGKILQKTRPVRPSLHDIRSLMGASDKDNGIIQKNNNANSSAPKAYAPLTAAESAQLMKEEGLTDEEMEFLSREYGDLLDQIRKHAMGKGRRGEDGLEIPQGKIILTPEMRKKVAEYRARVARFPVLKRWKPALAACLVIDTYISPKQKLKAGLGPLLK